LEIVGQENHLALHAIDLDQCNDSAQSARIFAVRSKTLECDFIIPQDFTFGPAQPASAHPKAQVGSRARYPPDFPLMEQLQVRKIRVGLVKNDDFTGTNSRAHLGRTISIMLLGAGDQHEAGQKTVQIQPQMAFSRRFTTAMPSPIYRRGNQPQHGRVHNVDRAPEPGDAPFTLAPRKPRPNALQVTQSTPEKLFGHLRRPMAIGMRQGIARWRSGCADS
jgi:hypothetical protein